MRIIDFDVKQRLSSWVSNDLGLLAQLYRAFIFKNIFGSLAKWGNKFLGNTSYVNTD